MEVLVYYLRYRKRNSVVFHNTYNSIVTIGLLIAYWGIPSNSIVLARHFKVPCHVMFYVHESKFIKLSFSLRSEYAYSVGSTSKSIKNKQFIIRWSDFGKV